MYNELKTREDAWMQSVHESIDRLSVLIDAIPKDGADLPKDEYLCDKEVSRLLKVSRRTLSETGVTEPSLTTSSVARCCTSGARLNKY